MAKKSLDLKPLEVTVKFNGISPEEKPPQVALYLMGFRGKPEKKIATIRNGTLQLPQDLGKGDYNLAIGPDVEKVAELDPAVLQQFHSRQALASWQKAGFIEIPDLLWRPWFPLVTCVSGKAFKCTFQIGPVLPLGKIKIQLADLGSRISPLKQQYLSPFLTTKCTPLCYGVVEVYRRVCCCDPWIFIPRIPELIPEIVDRIPIPDPGPLFNPRIPQPIPRPVPRLLQRAIKSEEALIEPANWQQTDERVVEELNTLQNLSSQQAQYDFLVSRPHLIPVLCHHYDCTTTKLGETDLGPDGSFSYCFPLWLTLRNCTTTYFYKIKQWIGGQWVYVYDGEAAKAYFSGNQSAELKTYNPAAETCHVPEPPVDGQGRPFVMLQAIGATDSYQLHSPKQTANDGINAAIGANGGMLDQSYSTDCPLGGTLDLLLYFDPDLAATTASYYRFSLVAADASGNPVAGATPKKLNKEISWRKFRAGTLPPQIEGEGLGPKTIGGTEGLYQIPYVDATHHWLGNQYHYQLDTTAFANGKYLLMLELFNGAGQKIKPAGATGAEPADNFHFIWWKNATDTEVVNHNSLMHVLHFDNVKCFGDIVDLRKNSAANMADCQFMTGAANSQFSVGFRAYHQNDFMLKYQIDYFKGLNGSDVLLDTGINNRPATKGAGPVAESSSASFSTMLGSVTPGSKCTFSLDLYVWAKHSNGRSRLSGYDSSDEASFALEIAAS